MIDLYDLGTALLEAVATAFDDVSVALPARAYVHSGQVAVDCEQVVVQVGEVVHGLPDAPFDRDLRLPRATSATFSLWIVRCVPVQNSNGVAPSVTQLAASADELLQDRRLAWTVVMGTSWREACQVAAGESQTAYGPEGGFGGSITTVRVQV